jgi:hypothetical protein
MRCINHVRKHPFGGNSFRTAPRWPHATPFIMMHDSKSVNNRSRLQGTGAEARERYVGLTLVQQIELQSLLNTV